MRNSSPRVSRSSVSPPETSQRYRKHSAAENQIPGGMDTAFKWFACRHRCYAVFRVFSFCLLPALVPMSGCVPSLGNTDAALALEDIAAGWAPSRLKAGTPDPSRESVSYEIDGRRQSGDIYLSPDGALAGVVLVPGVAPAGRNDTRLVALATTLARLRFAVLVPDLPGPRRFMVRSSDAREVADAFRYLLSRAELAPGRTAGFIGISYAAGPVMLGALEPDVVDHVGFVLALGGYYSLRSAVTFFTTGYHRAESGEWRYLDPHPYAKAVFTISNASLLERPADRGTLAAYGRQLLDPPEFMNEVSAASLAPDARALYTLVANTDRRRVNALIDDLSPRIRNELDGINPAVHDFSRLGAQVLLVHGRDDDIIPYSESIEFAAALRPGQAKLFLVDGVAHADVRVTAQDIPQLMRAVELLLAHRSAASGPQS